MSEGIDTQFGPLPDHWDIKPLAELTSKIQDGTHFSPQSDEGPFRYVTSKNIRPGRLDLSGCGRISQEEHESIYARCDVKPGDVLLTKDGANTGNACLNNECEPFSLLSSVAFLRTEGTDNSAGFVLQYLLSAFGQKRLKDLMSGNAIPRLTLQKIKAFEIPVPPPPVQRRIAEILSIVDEAIEQTEVLIGKTQQIKTGLMHDLFTRGVTPDGRLRPPREEAPELYKESPLGWIPREWDVVLVDALCNRIVDCPHSTPTYISRGIPCIRTADMLPGELLLEQAYRVTEATYVDRVARLVPRSGDIIYSREGERLGIASPVGDERICLGQRVMLLRPNPETDGAFMLWAMNTASFYRRVVSGLGATTSPHVNVGDVRKQKILRPSISEQEVIGRTLTLLQMSLQAERTQREKYKATKFGLMNGLLTGRLRVKVDCDSRSMAVRNTNPKGDSNHESLG